MKTIRNRRTLSPPRVSPTKLCVIFKFPLRLGLIESLLTILFSSWVDWNGE